MPRSKVDVIRVFAIGVMFYLLCNSRVVVAQNRSAVAINTLHYDTVGILNGIFSIPELLVLPSPSTAQTFTFSATQKVIDYDVSPAGMEVAALIENPDGKGSVMFWQIGQLALSDSCQVPQGVKCSAIVWHPKANALFIMGSKDGENLIFRGDKNSKKWVFTKIFTSPNSLRRLVVCPRPFLMSYNEDAKQDYYSYRLFFGMDNGDASYRIVSITETGNLFYQVVGPANTITVLEDAGPDGNASAMEADWALPIAFHPGGHRLIFENKTKKFFSALYASKFWDSFSPMNITLKNGSITPTPNGLALLHWQKEKPGLGIYMLWSKKEVYQLTNYSFVSTPSSVPDGKGVVGLTVVNGRQTLNYLPINVPMADVVNAWMFANSTDEVSIIDKEYGLFRPNNGQQLYNLYESENYDCNSYSRNSPTRPYLVTTDIFWELFGAAYQGLFMLKEREESIPNFWKFVSEANAYLTKSDAVTGKVSTWTPVFAALSALNTGNPNAEVAKIMAEQDDISLISGEKYSYSNLKVRGHYVSSPQMKKYFKAFRFLTTIYQNNPKAILELNALPQWVIASATKWIETYGGFIAPSRSPLVWSHSYNSVPGYCKYPQKESTLFPLSWGFDNEVFNSTVFHPSYPANEIVEGKNGPRLLPSGLDIAAVLGSSLADNLLASDYKEYPNLRGVINNLKVNFKKSSNEMAQSDNLYSRWINALSVQWNDSVRSTNGTCDKSIWQTKRLQTGLATWATLRHATILVNEVSAAECGEGGFEEILMRAPRGYVEPDPNSFATIAQLFDKAIDYVSRSTAKATDTTEDYFKKVETRSLYESIKDRLKEASKEARTFQLMADKERKGIPLSNTENEKILFVARTAEHLFLVFNSLANKDYALSTPDPMAKIADVAGSDTRLMAAVGNAMEWDYVIPFYGRHQIVKGSIYSYYEFSSSQILNDAEWRSKVNSQEILPWLKPFIVNQSTPDMSGAGY